MPLIERIHEGARDGASHPLGESVDVLLAPALRLGHLLHEREEGLREADEVRRQCLRLLRE